MSIVQSRAVIRRPSTLMDSAIAPPRTRLRDVVELYMRNRLPQDLHPSFQAIGDRSAATRPTLPTSSQTEPNLRALRLHGEDEVGSEEDEQCSL